MSVYLVGRIAITDRATYAEYEAGFGEIFAKYGGEFLAVDDAVEMLEGEQTTDRFVLIRFASSESAKEWFHSDEYQELAAIRWVASNADIAIVSGPQDSSSSNAFERSS